MLARALQLLNAWWPDPARTSLGWWLIAIHVTLVLLVGGGITWSASRELHELADAQGKARVLLAATTAREELRRMAEDALANARALAERPTLQRLVAEGQSDALPPLLRRSCEAAGVDACALISGQSAIAVSGPAIDWSQVITASAEQGASFMALPALERVPVLGAWAPLAGRAQLRVYAVRRLDEHLGATLAHLTGVQVKLIDYRVYTAGAVNAFTPLYSAALADGHSAVLRIDSQDSYAASVPVFASTGEAIALIEALLPASAVDATVRTLIRRLLVTALLLAALAVLAGVLLAELVARPVRALTAAAMRIGSGDFSVSIPAGGAAEVGALARTMEDMRRNLIDLTNTLRQREAEARAVLGGIVEGVYAVDRERSIRYLNRQAARLLGVTAEEALGRFCGDVLKPAPEDGRRPCDFRCPILKARAEGSARALEHLTAAPGAARPTVIVSAAPVDGLQVQVMREGSEPAREPPAEPDSPQGA
jgi:PAS domain-containing protein